MIDLPALDSPKNIIVFFFATFFDRIMSRQAVTDGSQSIYPSLLEVILVSIFRLLWWYHSLIKVTLSLMLIVFFRGVSDSRRSFQHSSDLSILFAARAHSTRVPKSFQRSLMVPESSR